jgi:hypothetical protein
VLPFHTGIDVGALEQLRAMLAPGIDRSVVCRRSECMRGHRVALLSCRTGGQWSDPQSGAAASQVLVLLAMLKPG